MSTMDTDFQNEKFNFNNWLNSRLSLATSGSPTADLDNTALLEFILGLSDELSLEIDNTNAEIESVTQQIIQSMPQVRENIEATSTEIVHLQKELSAGLADAEVVQSKTSAPMKTLERLDSVKTKLVATSVALQEADKWTSLAKQIEQFLDTGDVDKSYECILGMEKTLLALNQTQAEERKLILEEFKNQLEALATKHLILAFDTNNTDNAHYFFTMFTNMERTKQFVKYFQNSEKIKLCQEWRKVIEIMVFKEASTKFYDMLIDHWHSKVQWCKLIFADDVDLNPSNVLLDLYTDTMRSLEPSLQFCFEAETKKVPFLELLIQFNQATHRFVSSVRQLNESQPIKADKIKINAFMKSLFEPFLTQYSKYSKFHESAITSKIQAANASLAASGSATGGRTGAAALQAKIDASKQLLTEIILHVKESEEKVTLFNHGFGYLHFGQGLNNGLERFVDWNQDIFKQLEKCIDNPGNHRNLVETTLAFAETCGATLFQLIKLDQLLSGNCGRVFGKMTSSLDNSNPWEDLWGFYLDGTVRSQILQFVQKKETLLGKVVNYGKKLCCDSKNLVSRVTVEPVENQLVKNFALQDTTLQSPIPSEYITQIGEYLMLLPQNLEPFIAPENSSIVYAFDQTPSEDSVRAPVDLILSNLSTSISEAYTQRILKCSHLTSGQAKQLAQDIDYLSSVFEDLGLHLSQDLTLLGKLMKNFNNLTDSNVTAGIPQRLVSAVRKMKPI